MSAQNISPSTTRRRARCITLLRRIVRPPSGAVRRTVSLLALLALAATSCDEGRASDRDAIDAPTGQDTRGDSSPDPNAMVLPENGELLYTGSVRGLAVDDGDLYFGTWLQYTVMHVDLGASSTAATPWFELPDDSDALEALAVNETQLFVGTGTAIHRLARDSGEGDVIDARPDGMVATPDGTVYWRLGYGALMAHGPDDVEAREVLGDGCDALAQASTGVLVCGGDERLVAIDPTNGDAVTELETGPGELSAVAANATHVFYTTESTIDALMSTLRRVPLDGSSAAEDVATLPIAPSALVADTTELFAITTATAERPAENYGQLLSVDLTSGDVDVIVDQQPFLVGLALDATHVYYAALGTSGMADDENRRGRVVRVPR